MYRHFGLKCTDIVKVKLQWYILVYLRTWNDVEVTTKPGIKTQM